VQLTDSPRLRSAALLVGGIAVGLAVAVGAGQVFGGSSEPTSFGRSASVDSTSLLDPDRVAEVEGPRTRADSPREAVEELLAAEQERDYEASFALLADTVRVDYGSAAAWAADHPDALPPVTGFEVLSEQGGGGQATVVTLTRYRSSLDPVTGLVPGRAETSWTAVEEDGGWAVDVSATTQQMLLPPDDAAVPAVQAWVQERQRCTPPPPDAPALRGRTELPAQLCGTSGARATTVGPLGQLDAGLLQNSYGADAVGWARTVAVDGPVPLRAVVAPIADSWVVVGLLAPAGQGR
jgi:hypothetical protein